MNFGRNGMINTVGMEVVNILEIENRMKHSHIHFIPSYASNLFPVVTHGINSLFLKKIVTPFRNSTRD